MERNRNEKQYIKPETVVMEIVIQMIATSFYIDPNSQGDYDEDFVKEYRRPWGNLWKQ